MVNIRQGHELLAELGGTCMNSPIIRLRRCHQPLLDGLRLTSSQLYKLSQRLGIECRRRHIDMECMYEYKAEMVLDRAGYK